MAVQRVLAIISGKIQEYVATVVSAGTSSQGNLVALAPTGLLDISVMPSGIGPNTATLPATETLAAGAWVNLWGNGGVFSVRNADGSTTGKEAHGFVLAAVASGASATVYFSGLNTSVTGMSPGPVYLGASAGVGSSSGNATAGQTYQFIGTATSATAVVFEPESPIARA